MSETQSVPPQVFVLTPNAARMVKTIMKNEGREAAGLRVTVSPGGCAGYSYGLDFEDQQAENDLVVECEGVKVFIDKDLEPLVQGASLDFQETLNGAGFVLDNPNAQRSCGCGKSFS